MFSVFVGECENLVSFLGAAAQSGEVLDFQQLMFDFTFDSICDIAFGVKMHQLGSKTPHPFCEAFDSLQTLVTARTVTAPMWWKSKRAFGVGNEKTFAAHVRVVDEFIMGIVRDRRKNPAEYQSDDLLSLFLEDAAKRGEELSDEMLRDLVLNFMVAGRDTTATALTWLFYALDQHPSIESTLVAEVQQRLSSSVQPTPESIKNLVQLEAAFMETTRVWPPVPADMKQCVKDVVWPGGCGTKIPKGTVMIYAPTLLHKLPEYYLTTSGLQHWAADCMEFKPQRWLVPDKDADGGLKILQPSAYDFVSFSTRICIHNGSGGKGLRNTP
jgi:cytochrome P450